MQAKRAQYLLAHQDTLLTPKGFLIGCIDDKKTMHELQKRPRQQNSVYAMFIVIEISDDCPILMLDAQHVLFSFDITFHITSIRLDASSNICTLHLKAMHANEVQTRILDHHKTLLQNVGECTNEKILFGSLLVEMNCVPAAMVYYSFHMNQHLGDSVLNAHRVVAMGRAALKCGRHEEAEKYYTQAMSLYEGLVFDNDLHFIRLLLDLGVVYVMEEKYEQAFCICERISFVLMAESSFPSISLRYMTQALMCFCQIA